MSLRCGCPAEGDDIVFGPVHLCETNAAMKAAVPRANRWVSALSQDDFTLSPPERPWEITLGPDDMT